MAYHPFRHLGLKFLSLSLAALLWLTVSREPIVERTLRVPLQFQNVPEQLQIVGTPTGAVDVRVRGSSGDISRLQPGELVAVLDLGQARSGSRLFNLMPDQVRAPFGVEVQQVAPATIGLEMQRRASKIVPVVPVVDGEPAPGFVVGTITSDPSHVAVLGPERALQAVTGATTEPISVEGATTTVRDQVTVGVTDSEARLQEARTATVTVAIVPAPVERVMTGIPVRMRNVSGRGQVTPGSVDVALRGTRDAVVQASRESIEAFVDLAGLGPGRYNLPVRVESSKPVGISRIEPATVQVRIR